MVFLSVLCLLGAKGLFIVHTFLVFLPIFTSTSAIIIGLQFVPQLILAVFTNIGFSWNSMKLILYHPECLLMSTGTHFNVFKQQDAVFRGSDCMTLILMFCSSVLSKCSLTECSLTLKDLPVFLSFIQGDLLKLLSCLGHRVVL